MTLFGVRHFSFATEARDARTELWIGPEALAAGAELMGEWLDGRSLYVVSTPRVLKLHGAALEPLRAAAARTAVLEVPEGEAAKTIDVASDLWRPLVADGVKRDSRLIAFGGGSVGDLGGFVAATTLRGIELALLPTTVLAQVDASIGGKTAIDLPEAKNAVGAFHPPRWVVGDTRWLATLDVAEARAGWVEAVKKAIAFDVGLFERFEEAGLERGYVEEHGQLPGRLRRPQGGSGTARSLRGQRAADAQPRTHPGSRGGVGGGFRRSATRRMCGLRNPLRPSARADSRLRSARSRAGARPAAKPAAAAAAETRPGGPAGADRPGQEGGRGGSSLGHAAGPGPGDHRARPGNRGRRRVTGLPRRSLEPPARLAEIGPSGFPRSSPPVPVLHYNPPDVLHRVGRPRGHHPASPAAALPALHPAAASLVRTAPAERHPAAGIQQPAPAGAQSRTPRDAGEDRPDAGGRIAFPTVGRRPGRGAAGAGATGWRHRRDTGTGVDRGAPEAGAGCRTCSSGFDATTHGFSPCAF